MEIAVKMLCPELTVHHIDKTQQFEYIPSAKNDYFTS